MGEFDGLKYLEETLVELLDYPIQKILIEQENSKRPNKQDTPSQVIDEDERARVGCERCQEAHHIYSLLPPMSRVPSGEWRCVDCKNVRKRTLEAANQQLNSFRKRAKGESMISGKQSKERINPTFKVGGSVIVKWNSDIHYKGVVQRVLVGGQAYLIRFEDGDILKVKCDKLASDDEEVDSKCDNEVEEPEKIQIPEKEEEEVTEIATSQKRRRRRVKVDERQRRSPEKWTEEEDSKLLSIVQQFPEREERYPRWSIISKEMGTKSANQCYQRWNRVVRPDINKDPWNNEEKALLLKVITSFGKNKISWSQVSKQIKGRTDTQCRYQYLALVGANKVI